MAYGLMISARQARAEENQMRKTKQGALKAAREALGEDAIEGIDFILRQTGAGWTHEDIPPANDAAAAAQGERIKLKPTDEDPLMVDGKRFPNISRANEARRLLDQRAHEAAEAQVAGDPPKHAAAKKASAKAPRPPKAASPKKAPAAKSTGKTKADVLLEMLTGAGGATSKEMEEATGWQPHSVRGFLGTQRKKGVKVVSKKLPNEPTIYRIEATAPASVGDVV